MTRKQDKNRPRPAVCPHVDIHTWETDHKGVTRPIHIKWSRCRDCGKVWSEVSD